MKTSERGIALIKEFEGCELEAYLDAVDVLTIGYGHTGDDVYLGLTITQAEADDMLARDLDKFEAGIERMVKVPLNANQHAALVSFSFNLGLGSLSGSTLLRKLNALDYDGAADEFPRWNRAGGNVLAGLSRRRKAEQALFLDAE